MNRLISLISSIIISAFIFTAAATEGKGTYSLMPDISTHYDRIMAAFTESSHGMFTHCIDLGLLDAADINETEDELTTLKSSLVDYAKSFLGRRYKSGGKGPKVFDCSGFTSYVFRNFGFDLNGASRTQSVQGERVEIHDAQVGDLIFFSGRRGGKTVGHVGMVVEVAENGTMKFIHASTSKGVVIQNYPDGGYYSKRFLHVQRVIS